MYYMQAAEKNRCAAAQLPTYKPFLSSEPTNSRRKCPLLILRHIYSSMTAIEVFISSPLSLNHTIITNYQYQVMSSQDLVFVTT
jgi:hypothetical protein